MFLLISHKNCFQFTRKLYSPWKVVVPSTRSQNEDFIDELSKIVFANDFKLVKKYDMFRWSVWRLTNRVKNYEYIDGICNSEPEKIILHNLYHMWIIVNAVYWTHWIYERYLINIRFIKSFWFLYIKFLCKAFLEVVWQNNATGKY